MRLEATGCDGSFTAAGPLSREQQSGGVVGMGLSVFGCVGGRQPARVIYETYLVG